MIERAVMLVCYERPFRQQPLLQAIVHAEATGPPRLERRALPSIKQHVIHVVLGDANDGAVLLFCERPPARPLRDLLLQPPMRMGSLSAAAVPPHVFIWVQPPEINIICKFKFMQIQVEISC